MKAFTDLEQSKKLADILPIISADMYYQMDYNLEELIEVPQVIEDIGEHFSLFPEDVPCWSLAALFNLFDWPELSTSSLGDGSIGVMISVYPNGYRHDSGWHDNPVDACVEMIVKLKEKSLL